MPKAFKKIRLILSKKIKVYELKNKNLKSNLKIKVNKIQIGSDRLANAMGAMDNKKLYRNRFWDCYYFRCYC